MKRKSVWMDPKIEQKWGEHPFLRNVQMSMTPLSGLLEKVLQTKIGNRTSHSSFHTNFAQPYEHRRDPAVFFNAHESAKNMLIMLKPQRVDQTPCAKHHSSTRLHIRMRSFRLRVRVAQTGDLDSTTSSCDNGDNGTRNERTLHVGWIVGGLSTKHCEQPFMLAAPLTREI